MEVRSATQDDISAVAGLNSSARNEPDGSVGIEYVEADFRKYTGKDFVVFLVAVEGNEVLGFTLAYDHVDWGYVDVLCVAQAHRSKGVGSKLLAAVEEIGKARDWTFIELCRDESDKRIGGFVEKRSYTDTGLVRWYGKPLQDSAGEGRSNWASRSAPIPLDGEIICPECRGKVKVDDRAPGRFYVVCSNYHKCKVSCGYTVGYTDETRRPTQKEFNEHAEHMRTAEPSKWPLAQLPLPCDWCFKPADNKKVGKAVNGKEYVLCSKCIVKD